VNAVLYIRTLLADDEEPSVRHLTRLLKPFSEIVLVGVATDGAEAVEMIDRLQPDLVFMDIEMPGCNGFQVLQRLRHKPLVVFTSAYTQYRQMAYDTDALAYLFKPIEAQQVRNVIERILRIRDVLIRTVTETAGE
jgi:two-component system LytT family response regulator